MATPVFSEEALRAILADDSKYINEDVRWTEKGTSRWVCSVAVLDAAQNPLRLTITINRFVERVSFSLHMAGVGRIYGLDVGQEHRNPGERDPIGEVHKNRWREGVADGWAYVPEDITARPPRFKELWEQFCAEARISHYGDLLEPPWQQQEIPWN